MSDKEQAIDKCMNKKACAKCGKETDDLYLFGAITNFEYWCYWCSDRNMPVEELL